MQITNTDQSLSTYVATTFGLAGGLASAGLKTEATVVTVFAAGLAGLVALTQCIKRWDKPWVLPVIFPLLGFAVWGAAKNVSVASSSIENALLGAAPMGIIGIIPAGFTYEEEEDKFDRLLFNFCSSILATGISSISSLFLFQKKMFEASLGTMLGGGFITVFFAMSLDIGCNLVNPIRNTCGEQRDRLAASPRAHLQSMN